MNTSQLLARADELLATISVKGDDVYTMTNIRGLLKTAWDQVKKQESTSGGEADGR